MKQKHVDIEIDLPDGILLELCLMAHKADMTLNAFVNKVIKEYAEKVLAEKEVADKATAEKVKYKYKKTSKAPKVYTADSIEWK